ncbi:hypothetical protein DXG01_012235, partial [Tephrocybe rancida]
SAPCATRHPLPHLRIRDGLSYPPTPSTPSVDSSEEEEEHEGEVSAVDEGVEQESEKDLPMGEFSDDPPSPPLGDQSGDREGLEDSPLNLQVENERTTEGQGGPAVMLPQVAAPLPASDTSTLHSSTFSARSPVDSGQILWIPVESKQTPGGLGGLPISNILAHPVQVQSEMSPTGVHRTF